MSGTVKISQSNLYRKRRDGQVPESSIVMNEITMPVSKLPGPQGPQGFQGEDGPMGFQGDQGEEPSPRVGHHKMLHSEGVRNPTYLTSGNI